MDFDENFGSSTKVPKVAGHPRNQIFGTYPIPTQKLMNWWT